ncbi:MAG TPA: glycosyltransferase N-terminal domain-containing protein [Chitinophagaceae bacterium]
MSLLLYRLFLWMYPTALRLVSPWNTKAKRWLQGRDGIMERLKAEMPVSTDGVVWMHCASLGEFEQGRPVLESLRAIYPDIKFVISFFSPSGYDAARRYLGANYIFYLPMDSLSNARQLVDIIKPTLVLWVKYDYWYYYMNELRDRGIPLLLLSGVFRKDQSFFRWYGGIHRKMLRCVTQFFVQSELSQELLHSLKVFNVTVSGDTRFDRVIEIAETAGEVDGIQDFCNHSPVIVAGSTWEEDEEELDHFANTHTDIKFIIAPHEVNETRLSELEKMFKYTIRYSALTNPKPQTQTPVFGKPETGNRKPETETQNPKPETQNPKPETPNVLIIDNIGLLSRLYRYATIAWVGGGFGNDGVHNVLEAAVYGKPVVFGPVYDKYLEAIELVGSGGGFSVENALEAEGLFTTLLIDKEEYDIACEASREYVYAKQGATEKIIDYIQEKRLLTS